MLFGLRFAPNFPNFGPHLLKSNYNVRMHPYARPQHMKVSKHFICIQYGYVMQSGVIFSVKHYIMISSGLTLKLNLPQINGDDNGDTDNNEIENNNENDNDNDNDDDDDHPWQW
jgi:hypothetical protein